LGGIATTSITVSYSSFCVLDSPSAISRIGVLKQVLFEQEFEQQFVDGCNSFFFQQYD